MKNAVMGLMLFSLVATPLLADTPDYDRTWDNVGWLKLWGVGEADVIGVGTLTVTGLESIVSEEIKVVVSNNASEVETTGEWTIKKVDGGYEFVGWGTIKVSGVKETRVDVYSLGNKIYMHADGDGFVGVTGEWKYKAKKRVVATKTISRTTAIAHSRNANMNAN